MGTATSVEEAIFCEALELDVAEEREAFLQQACAGNPALRAAVEELLRANAQAESFFRENSALLKPPEEVGAQSNAYTDASVGTFIGPYRLAQWLGEGGGGIVYMAEQATPVQRQVALKIIKLGMDTRRVIARFEAERQTLALMEHPNIARVLDAGATETGRPFFVMELVRGVKITDYFAENAVPLRERLALFQQICHAIQHAHQKGIIHRDIKPSNILITLQDGQPVPKVIDFGIAKATAGPLSAGTLFTVNEQLVGTPAYMSPEQIQGGMDVDTRSDIYSLGIVLYELLAGRPPFDNQELLRLGVDEMRRVLRDQEPPRPSISAAQSRDATAESLRWVAAVRGDLDWIVMKALEKDRDRRYQTARGLALDIDHYLRDEPIQARPPSRRYRLRKLVRRNKATFAAIGATTLVLVVGLAVSTWLFFRASRAERQQTQLRAVAEEALAHEAELRRRAEEREKVARAAILMKQGKIAGADALLGDKDFHLSQPSLEATQVFRDLAEWNALQGNWRKSATRLLALIQVNRFDENDQTDNATRDLLPVAPTLIEAGDRDAYEKVCRLAISRFAGSQNPIAAEHIIKISLLLPPGREVLTSLEPLVRVAEDSVKNQDIPRGYLESWRCMVLGLLEYRRGHDEAAWDLSRRSLAFPERTASRDAAATLVQAMAAWRMKRDTEARAKLRQARQTIEDRFGRPLILHEADKGAWFDWLDARILLREATALIDGDPASHSPAGH
jgi:serine/threonine protein kinase